MWGLGPGVGTRKCSGFGKLRYSSFILFTIYEGGESKRVPSATKLRKQLDTSYISTLTTVAAINEHEFWNLDKAAFIYFSFTSLILFNSQYSTLSRSLGKPL